MTKFIKVPDMTEATVDKKLQERIKWVWKESKMISSRAHSRDFIAIIRLITVSCNVFLILAAENRLMNSKYLRDLTNRAIVWGSNANAISCTCWIITNC